MDVKQQESKTHALLQLFDKKVLHHVPMASREFTPSECYTNAGSLPSGGRRRAQ